MEGGGQTQNNKDKMEFEFVFEEEVSPDQLLRALHPSTRQQFLSFCLSAQYQLGSAVKKDILTCLLDCDQPESDEGVEAVCNAFQADESDPWLGVLAGMVLHRFRIATNHGALFTDTLLGIKTALSTQTAADTFTLPKHVVPKHWAYLPADSLPQGFDSAETMRNDDFDVKIAFPERITQLIDESNPNRRDLDLVRLFFMPGINLEKVTEIYLEQEDSEKDGKPVTVSTYLKLDPSNPEKKMWNTVKRMEKKRVKVQDENSSTAASTAD